MSEMTLVQTRAMKIGEAMKSLRALNGNTHGFYLELARRTGIDYQRVRHLVSDSIHASEDDLNLIRRAYKLNPDWPKPAAREDAALYRSSPTTLSTLIDTLATPGVPESVRAQTAHALRKELGLPDE